MKKIVLFICTCCLIDQVLAQPRVFLLSPDKLQNLRQAVADKRKFHKVAVNQLMSKANDALSQSALTVMNKKDLTTSGNKHYYMSLSPYYWPDPMKPDGIPYIKKDGRRNPEIYKITDRSELGKLTESVNNLALAYYVTGQERYAKKAITLIKTWFLDTATAMYPNLDFAQAIVGRKGATSSGLIETISFISLIDDIGLLSTSGFWSKKDQHGMEAWFSKFATWMKESESGKKERNAANNHGTYYDLQLAVYSLFVDDTAGADAVLNHSKDRISTQISTDGRQELEIKRTKGLSYSIFNLKAFFYLARVAEKRNIDLWYFQVKSDTLIKKAFDWILPYATSEKGWPYQQVEPFKIDEVYQLLVLASEKYKEPRYLSKASTITKTQSDIFDDLL